MSGMEFGGVDPLPLYGSLFSIPHDPASLMVYALLVLTAFAIWYGDRHGNKRGSGSGPEPGETTGSTGSGDEHPHS